MAEQTPDPKPPYDDSKAKGAASPTQSHESIFGRPSIWTETFKQRDTEAAEIKTRVKAVEEAVQKAQKEEHAKTVQSISRLIASIDQTIRRINKDLEKWEEKEPPTDLKDIIDKMRALHREMLDDRERNVEYLRRLTSGDESRS